MKTLTLSLTTLCVIFSTLFICCSRDNEEPSTLPCSDHTEYYYLNKAEKNMFSTTGFDTFYMTGNNDTVSFVGTGKLYDTYVEQTDHPNSLCKDYKTIHKYEVYHLSLYSSLQNNFMISVYKYNSYFNVFFMDEKYQSPLSLIGDTVSKSVITYPSMLLNGKEYKNVTEFNSERDSTNKIFLNREYGLVKVLYPKYNISLARL